MHEQDHLLLDTCHGRQRLVQGRVCSAPVLEALIEEDLDVLIRDRGGTSRRWTGDVMTHAGCVGVYGVLDWRWSGGHV